MTTKAGRGGLGTTLVLAVLLVVVSAAAGVGLTLAIWNPTTRGEGEVVLGIGRLNELATVEQTVQSIVVEEDDPTRLTDPLPDWLAGRSSSSLRSARSRPGWTWTSSRTTTCGSWGRR